MALIGLAGQLPRSIPLTSIGGNGEGERHLLIARWIRLIWILLIASMLLVVCPLLRLLYVRVCCSSICIRRR